jgi:hypothetical protein
VMRCTKAQQQQRRVVRWGLVGQLATLAVSFRCLSKCDLPTML